MTTMKDYCSTCELRGYSRELCAVHMRHCGKNPEPHEASQPVKIGGKVVAGVVLGMVSGALAATAASFVGGAVLLKLLCVKLVAGGGAVGGGVGLARGVKGARQARADGEDTNVASGSTHYSRRRAAARLRASDPRGRE